MRPIRPLSRSLPLLLVVAATLGGCGDEAAARAREDALRSELKGEIEKARKDADRASQQAASARDEARNLRNEVGALSARVADLEARPEAAGMAAGAAPPAAKPAVPDRKALLAEMKALQDKVFTGAATDEEQQRFWELARNAAVIDEVMKSLEAKVGERPEDVDARMQLARAYVAKLMSIPQGPEQGLWSNKAMAQWQAVLKQEPENWDARYSVALSWSMWPDFLNKTPDAVKEFEKLQEIQERLPVAPKQAQTYLQLSRLYQKQGKADRAKEILRTGLARLPDDAELRKALGALEE